MCAHHNADKRQRWPPVPGKENEIYFLGEIKIGNILGRKVALVRAGHTRYLLNLLKSSVGNTELK